MSPGGRIRDQLVGAGRFVDDISHPDRLEATLARSPVAHGQLVSIDADASLDTEGVVAVLTADRHTVRVAGGMAVTALVERSSRHTLVAALPGGCDSHRTAKAVAAALRRQPANMVRTLTWDTHNGGALSSGRV